MYLQTCDNSKPDLSLAGQVWKANSGTASTPAEVRFGRPTELPLRTGFCAKSAFPSAPEMLFGTPGIWFRHVTARNGQKRTRLGQRQAHWEAERQVPPGCY